MINGAVSGKGKIYKGLLEVTDIDVSQATVTTTTAIPLHEVTLAQINANYDAYVGMRIKVTGLTTESAVNVTKANVNLKQGTASQEFRPYFNLVLNANAVIDAIVYPGYFNNPQIAIWSADDVTVTSEGDVPVVHSAVSLPYAETFLDGSSDFTEDAKVLPSNKTSLWTLDAKYGAKATSGSKVASESWFVSPVIDMSGVTTVTASFEQAGKFFGTMATEIFVMIRQEGGEWTAATMSAYPTNTSWDYVSTTVDLSSLAGKKGQIAFRYISTTSAYGTWEIKNLNITGE